jgi:hypothetical protein
MRVGHGTISTSGLAANVAQKLVLECLLPFGRHNGTIHMNADLADFSSRRALEIAAHDDVCNRKRIAIHNREVGPCGVRHAILEPRLEPDNPDLADEVRLFGRLPCLKPASAHVSANGDLIDSAYNSQQTCANDP